MIPSKDRCYELLAQTRMPSHIAAHSIQVCRVSRWLTRALISCGAGLDMELVTASALLHDITKPRSFETGESHSETGAVFLAGYGYHRVGAIVRQHVRLDSYEPEALVTEAGIVNYADKRILHDRVASLARRMAYILERYGRSPSQKERIRWLWQVSEALEKRIYQDLPFAPEDLPDQIPDSGLDAEMEVFRLKAEGERLKDGD